MTDAKKKQKRCRHPVNKRYFERVEDPVILEIEGSVWCGQCGAFGIRSKGRWHWCYPERDIEGRICDVSEDWEDEVDHCPSCGGPIGDLRPCPHCGWPGICDECHCNLGPDEIDLCDSCEFMICGTR